VRSFGAEVVGYRSPSWDFIEHTEALLERHGLLYSSNFMDDLVPYRRAGTSLIEVPVQWIMDDAPHFWFDAATWTKKITSWTVKNHPGPSGSSPRRRSVEDSGCGSRTE
jgi:peptidoglycan-N-acetylglucosamine deacetylase